jgi:hypothetical protein
MEKTVKIEHSTDDIAELLFNLDNQQVAEVISKWKLLFDQNYEDRKANKEPIWIFDLNHFMMHVIDEMDEDALDFIRSSYSSLVYKLIDKSEKKHLLDLHLI